MKISPAQLRRYGLLAGIVVVGTALISALGYAIVFGLPGSHEFSSDKGIETLEHNVVNGVFDFQTANLTLEVLPTWTFLDPSTARHLEGMGKPAFVLQKSGSSCVFAYYRQTSLTWHDSYKQSSFGERIFTVNGQFDPSWYVPNTNAPELEFSWRERQPRASEVLVAGHSDGIREMGVYGPSIFALFMNDDAIVPDDCTNDFGYMLSTIRQEYKPIEVTRDMSGVLVAHGERLSGNNGIGRFLFRPEGQEAFGEILQSRGATYGGHRFLYDNTLYVAFDGIYIVNPFEKSLHLVTGTAQQDGSEIGDVYLKGDRMFYLSGTPCSYMSDCHQSLYEVPRTGGVPTLLVQDFKGSSIMGYSAPENRLYLSDGWGDAGCFRVRVSSYDFQSSTLQPYKEFGGCSEDVVEDPQSEYSVATRELTALRARVGHAASANYLLLKQGTYVVPPEGSTDFTDSASIWVHSSP